MDILAFLYALSVGLLVVIHPVVSEGGSKNLQESKPLSFIREATEENKGDASKRALHTSPRLPLRKFKTDGAAPKRNKRVNYAEESYAASSEISKRKGDLKKLSKRDVDPSPTERHGKKDEQSKYLEQLALQEDSFSLLEGLEASKDGIEGNEKEGQKRGNARWLEEAVRQKQVYTEVHHREDRGVGFDDQDIQMKLLYGGDPLGPLLLLPDAPKQRGKRALILSAVFLLLSVWASMEADEWLEFGPANIVAPILKIEPEPVAALQSMALLLFAVLSALHGVYRYVRSARERGSWVRRAEHGIRLARRMHHLRVQRLMAGSERNVHSLSTTSHSQDIPAAAGAASVAPTTPWLGYPVSAGKQQQFGVDDSTSEGGLR